MSTGLFKGKMIDYRPGRLTVGVKRFVEVAVAKIVIEEFGGKVLHVDEPKILEVAVEPSRTLEIAEQLATQPEFRFVAPIMVERKVGATIRRNFY